MLLFLSLACNPCPADAVCLDDGWFLVHEPEVAEHTLLWLHGWGGDAYHIEGRGSDLEALLDAGFRVLAPQGSSDSWNSNGGVGRDDVAFLEQVVGHVDGPVLAAGHSVGASMASKLVCDSESVAGLAAMHGTFWDPIPTCSTSARPVRHVHGTGDTTWPMEGRDFYSQTQGAIPEAVEMWRDHNGCAEVLQELDEGPSACTVWSCAGAEVRYCEHNEEHRMPDGFGARLAEWWSGAH